MKVEIINGQVCIDICEYASYLSREEKIELLNNLKVQDEFFQIFMEMFAWDHKINNPECCTSSVYEWRKRMLNMAKEKFWEELDQLNIISDLERKYKAHLSNERLYWHIYHDAPQHIRDYFQNNPSFKSEYDYTEEWKQFRKQVIDTILKN